MSNFIKTTVTTTLLFLVTLVGCNSATHSNKTQVLVPFTNNQKVDVKDKSIIINISKNVEISGDERYEKKFLEKEKLHQSTLTELKDEVKEYFRAQHNVKSNVTHNETLAQETVNSLDSDYLIDITNISVVRQDSRVSSIETEAVNASEIIRSHDQNTEDHPTIRELAFDMYLYEYGETTASYAFRVVTRVEAENLSITYDELSEKLYKDLFTTIDSLLVGP